MVRCISPLAAAAKERQLELVKLKQMREELRSGDNQQQSSQHREQSSSLYGRRELLKQWSTSPHKGLVLLCGPEGVGKSSLLEALIEKRDWNAAPASDSSDCVAREGDSNNSIDSGSCFLENEQASRSSVSYQELGSDSASSRRDYDNEETSDKSSASDQSSTSSVHFEPSSHTKHFRPVSSSSLSISISSSAVPTPPLLSEHDVTNFDQELPQDTTQSTASVTSESESESTSSSSSSELPPPHAALRTVYATAIFDERHPGPQDQVLFRVLDDALDIDGMFVPQQQMNDAMRVALMARMPKLRKRIEIHTSQQKTPKPLPTLIPIERPDLRLSYALNTLIQQVLSTNPVRIIIGLDNLQHACPLSKLLLERLLAKTNADRLVVLGCVRDAKPWQACDLDITLLMVPPPTHNNVQQLVEHAFRWHSSTDKLAASQLARAIYDVSWRSIKHNLDALHARRFLVYQQKKWRCEWSKLLQLLDSEKQVGGLEYKLEQSLSTQVVTMLHFASCLPSTIHLGTLYRLIRSEAPEILTSIENGADIEMRSTNATNNRLERLLQLLDAAARKGLLNPIDTNQFQFGYDMTPDVDWICVGRNLLQQALEKPGGRPGWLLPLAAECWSRGVMEEKSDDESEATDKYEDMALLARLLLDAGESAVAKAMPNDKYFRMGLDILERFIPNQWLGHYDLTVRLLFGAIHTSNDVALAKQTLKQKALQPHNRSKIQLWIIQKYLQQGQWSDAQRVCQSALSDMGQFAFRPMPQGQFFLVSSASHGSSTSPYSAACCTVSKQPYTSLRKQIANLATPKFFESMRKVCRHTEVRTVMAFLSYMTRIAVAQRFSVRTGSQIALQCIVRQLEMTAKHGWTGSMGSSLAVYAKLLCESFGEISEGKVMAGHARSVLEAVSGEEDALDALWTAVTGVDAWVEPTHVVLDGLRGLMQRALSMGDLASATSCRFSCAPYALQGGYPLAGIRQLIVEELGDDEHMGPSVHAMSIQCRLLVEALQSDSKPPIKWSNLENDFASKSSQNPWAWWSHVRLAYHFEEFKVSDVILDSAPKFGKDGGGGGACLASPSSFSYLFTVTRLFYGGLIAAQLTRRTKKRKYRQRLRTILEETKRMLGRCHQYLLLRAEYDSLSTSSRRNVDGGECLYDQAAEMALRQHENYYDAALAHHLAGRHYLHARHMNNANSGPEEEDARRHLLKARDLYKKWGAAYKVGQVDRMLDKLTPAPPKKVPGSMRSLSDKSVSSLLRHGSAKGLSLPFTDWPEPTRQGDRQLANNSVQQQAKMSQRSLMKSLKSLRDPIKFRRAPSTDQTATLTEISAD